MASDWGGYADPNTAACGSNYRVSSTSVTAPLGNGNTSLVVGTLEIKWSNGCPGNYARFQTGGGIYATWIGISIQSQASPYNKAGADESGTVAWTHVIALAHSYDRVCAYLDVNLYVQGNLVHGSKVLCA